MTKHKNIWLEDKLNLLKSLVDITRKDFLVVLQLFLLMFIAGMMYFSYLYLNSKIDKINETVNPNEGKAVIENSTRDVKINSILDDLRQETAGDRTKLFQFHNGQRNLKDIPFLYASVTHERIGAGISSEIQSLQRIPSSIFATNIQGYLRGETRCIETENNPNDAQRALLEAQRVKESCSFAVFMDDDIVGFITINYVIDGKPDREIIDLALRKASVRISDVLGGETL